MADVKITQLTATTAPLETDLMVMVSDPAGTPATKKTTFNAVNNMRILRSIVPAAGFTLTAGTSAQNAFPTTGDVFTLAASSSYMFDGLYNITKSGATCQVSLSFVLGGGASITSIKYTTLAQNIAKNTAGTTLASALIDQTAATIINAGAGTEMYVRFSGIIRMNAGGTVTPQITFNVAPTSPVMVADSFLQFTYIGTNVENTTGNVA